MARILFGMHVREEDPLTVEEIGAAFGLPLEAVQEAIAYCRSDPLEIQEDWQREEANIKMRAIQESEKPHPRRDRGPEVGSQRHRRPQRLGRDRRADRPRPGRTARPLLR